MKMNFQRACLLLCVISPCISGEEPKNSADRSLGKIPSSVTLSPQEASKFIPRRGRDLIEECYGESCSFEDINEVLGPTDERDRFWRAYKCRTSGLYCPTENPTQQTSTKQVFIPCSHRRDCSLGQWGEWLGAVPEKGCTQQVRSTLFRYPIKVTWKKTCIGLVISCPPPPQESRLICSCNQTICLEGSWSNWEGDPPLEGCKVQRRYRSYTETVAMTLELESCGRRRLQECPESSSQNRTICNCRKLVCSLGPWSNWKGMVRPGTCGELVRVRTYNTTWMYVQARDTCDSVTSLDSCPSPLEEKWKLCSCTFAQCNLGSWSSWSSWALTASQKNSQCQSRGKTRNYSMKIIFKVYEHMNECPKLPQRCPDDMIQTERRCNCSYIECTWSSWSKKTFSAKSRCYLQSRTRSVPLGIKVSVGRENCKSMKKHCDRKFRETKRECYRVKNGSHVSPTVTPTTRTLPPIQHVASKDSGVECTRLLELSSLLQSNPLTRKSSIGLLCSNRVLQIDFKKRKKITGMLNHGEGSWNNLMTVYTLDYSTDGHTWEKYKRNGMVEYFTARTSKYEGKKTILDTPIVARHLKFNPLLWTTTSTCLRIRLFGCEVEELHGN